MATEIPSFQKRQKYSWVDRSLSLPKISWDKKVHFSSIQDAYATFKVFFIEEQEKSYFKKAYIFAKKNTCYFYFAPQDFDQSVQNHFPLCSFSSKDFAKVRRPASLLFSSFSERVSPVVVALFRNGFFLLDGNHRSIASGILHSDIRAIVLDLRKLSLSDTISRRKNIPIPKISFA